MTHAASSPALAAEGLNARELQQMAAAAQPTGDGAARRGPFRPEVWLNARQRRSTRLAAHYFRAGDVGVILVVTAACAVALSPVSVFASPVGRIAPLFLGLAAVLMLLRVAGLYRFDGDANRSLHLAKVAGVVAAGLAVALAAAAVVGDAGPLTAGFLIWGGLMLISLNGLHMAWGDLVERWRRSGVLTPNIVVVGATRHAERLIREALDRRDLNVLGVFDDRLARSPETVHGVPVLGDAAALSTHRMLPYVDRIVLAIDPKAQGRVRELTARLSTLPNEVTLLVDPQGATERGAALDALARAPLAPLDAVDDDRRAFHKRLQDLVVGSLALLLLSPIMLAVALAIKLDGPGPIFFRQRRHGFNQETITVWKFRSMRPETADATASRQVTHDDDRVTRVGRFLRSTSLDELPQLLNVLRGEMSLIGPRPHAIGMKTGAVESARLVAEYAHRHRIKPGMTGWAAIHGSRGPLHTAQDVRRRVQLDIEYVERQSLWLDLYIMALTVPVLLGDRLAVR